jgi:hypothetical protein
MICNAVGDTILYAPLGVNGEYEIPVGIRAIGPRAFANRTQLTKVIIPSYVNSIGESAFESCAGVTEVVITGNRNSDLLLDTKAFFACNNLAKIIFCGNGTEQTDRGMITLGASVFEGATKLKTITYEKGSNVTQIGARAFAACVLLEEAVIPATVTQVGDGAFSGCEGILAVSFAPNGQQVTFGGNVFESCKRLTTVNLPATIGYFDGSVFSGCDAITKIEVDDANPNFVDYNGALYTKDYSEILFYPKALDGDLSKLHPELKKLGNNVFQGNLKIKKVELSNQIQMIGNHAFDGCAELREITFAQGSTAMTIGVRAFAGCTQLVGIDLPACTTWIGDGAFEASGLTSFVIPESVTIVGARALNGTKITTIVIPGNVELIGDGAFANCTQLVTVTFEESTKPLALGTLENTEKNNGIFMGTMIKVFTVPERATHIGAYAFYQQTALTTVAVEEDSRITALGQYAFAEAVNLVSATLGQKMEEISQYAFYKTKLSELSVPNTVTKLGKYVLAYTELANITFAVGGDAFLTIEDYAFAGTKLAEITFPARLQKAYTVEPWSANFLVSCKTFYRIFEGVTNLTAIKMEAGAEYFCENTADLPLYRGRIQRSGQSHICHRIQNGR